MNMAENSWTVLEHHKETKIEEQGVPKKETGNK